MRPVRLVAVGDAPPLEALASRVALELHTVCTVEPGCVDAAPAYDATRNQHYATALLRSLAPRPHDGLVVVGVTGFDLFVPILTYVFGEAQMPGSAAIVSLHRLREEFYGLPPRPDVMLERLAKEVVHEVGHTYGLRHCDEWECVMASSHSVELIDVKRASFCARCVRAVANGAS